MKVQSFLLYSTAMLASFLCQQHIMAAKNTQDLPKTSVPVRRDWKEIVYNNAKKLAETKKAASKQTSNVQPISDPRTDDVVLSPIPLTLSNDSTTHITAPGYYVVVNSPSQTINGGTINNPNVMISIESNYVTLDLGGQILTGSGILTPPFSPEPTVPGGIINDTRVDASVGISTMPGLTGIEIFNGTLQYFSYEAISCIANNNVYLHDMLIQYCSSVTLPIFEGSATAILLVELVESKIDNIEFYSNRLVDFEMVDCSSTIVSNCVSEGLRGGGFSNSQLDDEDFVTYGVFCLSFLPVANDTYGGNVFKNIRINDVQSLSAIFGIFVSYDQQPPTILGTVIEDCIVTNLSQPLEDISNILDPATCEIRGIAVEGEASYTTINNCKVSNVIGRVKTGPGSFIYGSGLWNTMAAFNFEGVAGILVQNCNATNIRNEGWIAGSQPFGTPGATFPNLWPAAGFIVQGNCQDVTFDTCFVSTVDAGSTTANPTVAAGFFILSHYMQNYNQNSTTFKNCVAKFINGGEGSADYLVDFQPPLTPALTATFPAANSIIYENCIASNNYTNESPVPVSNGFSLRCPAQNVIYDNCQSQGHSQHGFRLDTSMLNEILPEGFEGILYRNCISQGEQLAGFNLGKPFNQVSLIECISNNNLIGFEMNNNQVNLLNCLAQFNSKEGFIVNPYYQYSAEAVTNTSLANLAIYGGDYTVQYSNGGATIQLVPNSFQPLPSSLPINGVNLTVPVPLVNSGPVVLVNNEPDPVNNGLYALSITYTTLYDNSIVLYQLTRVNPWVPTNTVLEGTKVLYKNSNAKQLYILKDTIVVGVDAPEFIVKDKHFTPDYSHIFIENCQSISNGGKGFKIRGKGVKCSNNKTVSWQ